MSIHVIFLSLFFILGLSLGPLAIAFMTAALSDRRGKALGDWSIGIGLKSVWRPALTYNAANELALKRRGYDEEHDEQKITFGGMFSPIERFLFDPMNRIHDFFGTPFCFVDERFGLIHDPRDSAIGRELQRQQHAGVYTQRVERGQHLVESVLGVFEFPSKKVGARLSDVWALVGGSFDAQVVRIIHEYYRKGQAPKENTTALRQLLVPVGAFIAIIIIGSLLAGSGGGGGGGAPAPSGNSTNVNIGTLALLLSLPTVSKTWRRRIGGVLAVIIAGAVGYHFFGLIALEVLAGIAFASILLSVGGYYPRGGSDKEPSDSDSGQDTPERIEAFRDSIVLAFAIGVLIGLAVLLYLLFPTWVSVLGIPAPMGIWSVVSMLVGMAFIPFVSAWFGRSLGALGLGFGKLFLTIGLLPYDRPVITLVDRNSYGIVEYSEGDWAIEPQWYRFALTRVGVGFDSSLKVWDEDVVQTPAQVEAMGSLESDGGKLVEPDVAPPGYVTTSLIEQENVNGYVPEDVDEDSLYVRTDLTTGWFQEAGQNRRLMRTALETAKERYGGGKKPVGEKWILASTLVAIVLGMVFNMVVFF